MNIQEDLINCQNVLYKGFTTTKESGIDWLNGFCGEFLKFCNKLHKFLIFDCNQKTAIIETCFLCISQVVCCVKYMEKTIKIEETENIVMSLSRQYFLDRILWCFAHLKSTINSAQDDVIISNLQDANFVTSMDAIIELIKPYSAYKKDAIPNNAQFNAQAAFDSEKIRSTVDLLLSQALAFANVATDNDKIALTALCQKVLRECMAFQECCSLVKQASKPNSHLRQLKATAFENSLYQLEDFVNESLLRLIFEVMATCSTNSVSDLRHSIESSAGNELDSKITDFDINIDRILQIGIFAMALSMDVRAKTAVRSSLASLESLDSILIPSLYTKDDLHSTILEEHYHNEIRKFQKAIQDIIDTAAFCKCFEESLYDGIQSLQKEFDKIVLAAILEKANVLDEHFRLNADDLFSSNCLEPNFDAQKCYENFNLMLNECQAIFSCADQVENVRIIKRLKILRSTVKKLVDCTSRKEEVIVGGSTLKEKVNELSSENIVFESFGITPSVTSILYKPRDMKKISDSLKGNTSQLSGFVSGVAECNSPKTPKTNNKRRLSLRMAMFKRQKSQERNDAGTGYSEQSMSLHLSDILDKITNLSSTFTKKF